MAFLCLLTIDYFRQLPAALLVAVRIVRARLNGNGGGLCRLAKQRGFVQQEHMRARCRLSDGGNVAVAVGFVKRVHLRQLSAEWISSTRMPTRVTPSDSAMHMLRLLS